MVNRMAGANIKLPHPDYLMIKELKKGNLGRIKGVVDYFFMRRFVRDNNC